MERLKVLVILLGGLSLLTYLLVWAFCLAVWPEWVIRQWWSVLNADKLRRKPWYARLGRDPDTLPPLALRLSGIAMLSIPAAGVLAGVAGPSGQVAAGAILITIFAVVILYLVVRSLRDRL